MSGAPCARCGQVHTRCAAHNRAGGPCGVNPMTAQRVCRTHGGSAPQSRAAAEQRQAEERLEREITKAATTGSLPLLEPGTTLLEAVAMMAQVVGYLRSKVAANERPDPKLLDMFMAHVERLGRMAKLADDARLGERKLQREERLARLHGDELWQLLEAVVRALGHDPGDRVVQEKIRVAFQSLPGWEPAAIEGSVHLATTEHAAVFDVGIEP